MYNKLIKTLGNQYDVRFSRHKVVHLIVMKDRVARSCQESESESVSTMNKSQRLTSVSL